MKFTRIAFIAAAALAANVALAQTPGYDDGLPLDGEDLPLDGGYPMDPEADLNNPAANYNLPPSYNPYYQWCDRLSQRLMEAQGMAHMEYVMGNHVRAFDILSAALSSASIGMPRGQIRPFSRILIARALRYAQSFRPNVNPMIMRTATHFLSEYVSLIIRAADDLDPEYYFPAHFGRQRCAGRRGQGNCLDAYAYQEMISAFDAQLVQLASDEIQTVVNALSMSTPHVGMVPVGSVNVFLRATEMISREIAIELRQNLFAPVNACNLSDLVALNTRIRRYLQNGSGFVSLPHAVSAIAYELSDIAQSLEYNDGGCN